MKKHIEKPFSIELAKKITSGEVKGRIRTRHGRQVRIICFNMNNLYYPVIALVKMLSECGESSHYYTTDGLFCSDSSENPMDLVLEVFEEIEERPEFKPFQRVLVMGDSSRSLTPHTGFWHVDFFSHMWGNRFITVGGVWESCVPYEGNEHLLGTSGSPEK